MYFENFLLDAIDVVLSWDISEEEGFIEAVNSQACLMAGINPDEITGFNSN